MSAEDDLIDYEEADEQNQEIANEKEIKK